MDMVCEIQDKLKIIDKYVLGELSEPESETFEKHFFECDSCFNELKHYLEMVKLVKAQGKVLFSEYLNGKKKTGKKTRKATTVFRFPRFTIQFRPIYVAAAVLAIIIMGGFWGVRFFNTTYKVILAEKHIKENYRIYMAESPRISGGYLSTVTYKLMAEDDQELFYLDKAFQLSNEALNSGGDSNRINTLRFKIFIINEQYSKADSIFKILNEDELGSAEILNDMGVLQFSQENIERAGHYFQSAISLDSEFKEAYYNLAIVQNKLGQKKEAISSLNLFLELEKDEGWINAAKRYLNQINKK